MKLRKFEIISIEVSHGSPGPIRPWAVYYKAIVNKKWVQRHLWILARTKEDAHKQAMAQFGS